MPRGSSYKRTHLCDARIHSLKVKIFADGADAPEMLEMYSKPYIKGLTTNPTLMRKAGISNYRAFAREILAADQGQTPVFRSGMR